MKQLARMTRLELTACLRQLAASASCGTAEGVLLFAFGLIVSGALAWARMSGAAAETILASLFSVCALAGAAVFNRANALELFAGKGMQALRAAPVEPGAVLLVKAEKLLFASFAVFGAVIGAASAAMLLAGYAFGPVLLSAGCCCAAFCLGQNMRMLMVLHGRRGGPFARIATGALGVAVLIACHSALSGTSLPLLFEGLCRAYRAHMAAILAALVVGLVCVKALLYRCRGTQVQADAGEDGTVIPDRIAGLLERLDPVLRRDLRTMLHQPDERRALIRGAVSLPLIAWGGSALMRTGVVPMELTPRLSLLLILLLTASGMASLFERPMAMGREGGMILQYLMSGRRVSEIQGRRVRATCCLALPTMALLGAIAAPILGCSMADALLCLPAGLCGCAACIAIEGYAAIRCTCYHNETAAPRASSRLLGQLAKTALEGLFFAGAALTPWLPGGDWAVILAYGAAGALAALAAMRSIRKGDAKFYGEYQSIAV